jgi:ATP-dependent helicase HrpA
VTLQIPIASLAQLQDQDYSWLIDGLLTEKIAAYLKALPKRFRILLTPFPETVKLARETLNKKLTLEKALRTFLEGKLGVLGAAIWDHLQLPAYLKMHFAIIGNDNEIIAKGDNLPVLYEHLRDKFTQKKTVENPFDKRAITTWNFGDLPLEYVTQKNQLQVIYYPALTDQQNRVVINFYDSAESALYHHRFGLARLYLLNLKEAATFIKKQIQANKKSYQQYGTPFGEFQVLLEMLILSAAVHTFPDVTIRTQSAFEAALLLHRNVLTTKANTLCASVKEWLMLNQQISQQIKRLPQPIAKDIGEELNQLFMPHFMSHVPWAVLMRYTIYLKGILQRIEKIPRFIARDQEAMAVLKVVQKAYESKLALKKQTSTDPDDPLWLFRFKIEELRISLFAQSLGTQEPVSQIRLLKLLEKLG